MSAEKPQSRLMTVREVAAYTRVSYQTALDWIHQGLLPAVKLPARREDGSGDRRTYLVDRADIDALIDESKQRGGEAKPKLISAGRSHIANAVKRKLVVEKDWYKKFGAT